MYYENFRFFNLRTVFNVNEQNQKKNDRVHVV